MLDEKGIHSSSIYSCKSTRKYKINASITTLTSIYQHYPLSNPTNNNTEMRQEDQSNKCIIFSQYSQMLDLVHFYLRQNTDAGVVKLTGALSVKERVAVLKAFKTNPDVHVLLMSLKSGGEGLNLQEATRVYVLEYVGWFWRFLFSFISFWFVSSLLLLGYVSNLLV